MDWKDRGAVTVPAHGIYEEGNGKKSHGRVAIVFCSDECASKFAETMTETAKDLREYSQVSTK